MDLLREADTINLAPEVLEPEAQSIVKVCIEISLVLFGLYVCVQTMAYLHLGLSRPYLGDLLSDV